MFEGINLQGCRVVSFKAPSSTELSHDYLWRVHASLPAHGEIGIFNRSHYEDVVAVRMLGLAPKKVWSRRTGHIREFERMLADEGTTIVKVFLNILKDEQQKRLQERIDNADKRWKFRKADLDVRTKFDDYVAAWEDALTETSTDWAPWHVVPADRNWVKATAVATLLVDRSSVWIRVPGPEPGIEELRIDWTIDRKFVDQSSSGCRPASVRISHAAFREFKRLGLRFLLVSRLRDLDFFWRGGQVVVFDILLGGEDGEEWQTEAAVGVGAGRA